jgi:hypothetical protein
MPLTKKGELRIKKQTLIESITITTMLATVAMSMLCISVAAWTGSDTDFGYDYGDTWQVSAEVTGYYNTAGQYEEVFFETWRGCIEPTTYVYGHFVRFVLIGPPTGTADSGWVSHDGIYYPFTAYPGMVEMDYITSAIVYSGSYFNIGGFVYFKSASASI